MIQLEKNRLLEKESKWKAYIQKLEPQTIISLKNRIKN